jgi:hypothetical protein
MVMRMTHPPRAQTDAVDRDDMGWPIYKVGDERLCASGTKCRYPRSVTNYGETCTSSTASPEFRIDGYCSCECRDFDEMRQDHEAALRSARSEALEEAAAICDERQRHLEATSKRLDHDGQIEHYHRMLEAHRIAEIVRARAREGAP